MMNEALYRDILIENGDMVLDAGGVPVMVFDRACIEQDLQHALLESDLLKRLIGERNALARKTIYVEITLLVDADYRIKPGTARVQEIWNSRKKLELWITADTIDFGPVYFLAFTFEDANG